MSAENKSKSVMKSFISSIAPCNCVRLNGQTKTDPRSHTKSHEQAASCFVSFRVISWTASPLSPKRSHPFASGYCRTLSVCVLAVLFIMLLFSAPAALAPRTRKSPAASSSSTASLIIRSEPNAIVWLDEIRRGVTDGAGKLALEKVTAGCHTLRVRANGFKERTLPLASLQRGQIAVRLTRTTDEAELNFQKAEEARE